MPLQNRVTPGGDIVVHPARGLFMGNRGILHDESQTLGSARWTTQSWVICALSFGGRKRTLMTPGRYTELFFLDEAVALAAGHRPCSTCRRAAARAFADLWRQAAGEPSLRLPDIDRQLHRQRVVPRARTQVRHWAPLDDLPDGTFVRIAGQEAPCLVQGDRLLPYAYDRYAEALPRPLGAEVEVLTPAGTVAVLRAGYCPELHASAGPR